MSDAYKGKMQIKLTNDVKDKYNKLKNDEKIEYIIFVNRYKEHYKLKTKDHYFDEWHNRYIFFQENKNIHNISNKLLKNVIYDPRWSIEDFNMVGLNEIITFLESRSLIEYYFNCGKKRYRRKNKKICKPNKKTYKIFVYKSFLL